MAKKSTAQGEVSLSIEIREHLAHYAFSEGLPREGRPVAPSEFLSLWLLGEVVAPTSKHGRDIHVTMYEGDHMTPAWRSFAPDQAAVIGSLSWGATRTARVYVPPGSLWNLAHGVGARLFTRVQLMLAGPIRGNVDVRGMHMTTRELTLWGFGSAASE